MKKAGKTMISLMVSLGVAASGMFAYGAAPGPRKRKGPGRTQKAGGKAQSRY